MKGSINPIGLFTCDAEFSKLIPRPISTKSEEEK